MAFTFTIDEQWVEGNKRHARGTWTSAVGTDTGGVITTPLVQVDGFGASIDTADAFSVNPGAAVDQIDILHAAAIRSGTWHAWGA